MVNVLYIIQYLGHGGTERQLVELMLGLDKSRFCPHLCTLTPSEGLFEELSVPKIDLQFQSFGHPSIFSKLRQLSAFIREHNIHIVQTFSQDPFLIAAMVKPWHGFKLVGSFRDLGFWRTKAAVFKMRSAYPFCDMFIANSHAVKDFFVRADRLNADHIEVIYNGINVAEELSAHDNATLKSPPFVGIVANFNRPVKRVDDFIRMAALVSHDWPETRFVVVGEGPMRDELEKLSRSLGIEKDVQFTGQLTNPLDYVRSFRVGVITSETEGLCNAILEYMALGVPVVATATGGNPELIHDGENGFLVAVGDTEQMAKKVGILLKDEILRSQMGVANLKRVADSFSLPRMVAKHESLYERILNI